MSIFKEDGFAAMTSPVVAVCVMFGPGSIAQALDEVGGRNWMLLGLLWQVPAFCIAYAASCFERGRLWGAVDSELRRLTNKFAPWWSTGNALLCWVWPVWVVLGLSKGLRSNAPHE